jgi:hypothetical protein
MSKQKHHCYIQEIRHKQVNEYRFLHFGGKTIRRFDESCFTDLLITHILRTTFLSKFEPEPSDGTSKVGILYDGSSINRWHKIS